MIRPATPADLPVIRAIEAGSETAAHWSDEDYERLLAADSPRLVLVAENVAVSGFLIARQIGPEWEIENIAIAHAARRRGLGSELLDHFVGLLKRQRAASVFLEVRASNVVARSLYRKHGFVETGRRPLYYDHPAEDAVLYRLSLDRAG